MTRDKRYGHSSCVPPFPCSSLKNNAKDAKEWDDVRCPICMEHPHNAVLLHCASSEKGCHVFMCDTSYRHSNCFDQFRKVISGDASLQSPMTCPLCRGAVKGWTVDAAARSYMNSKIRSCSTESCGFVGSYEELRRHARLEHPCARPMEVDPDRQRNWSRMEQQRDLGDLLSNLHSVFGGHGDDLLRDNANYQDDQFFMDDNPLAVTLFIDNISYETGETMQPLVSARMVPWSSSRVSRSTEQIRMPVEDMDYEVFRLMDEFTVISDAESINIDMYCEDASTSRSRRGQRRLMPPDIVFNNEDVILMSGVNAVSDSLATGFNVVSHENATVEQVQRALSRGLGGGRRRLRPWDVVMNVEDADGMGRFAPAADGVRLYTDMSTHENGSMPARRASTRGSSRRLRRRGTWEEGNGVDDSSFPGFLSVSDACIEIDIGVWDHEEPPFPPQRRTRRRLWRGYEDE